MIKKVEFIMQDNTDPEEFVWALNEMCSKLSGMLQYNILEEDE